MALSTRVPPAAIPATTPGLSLLDPPGVVAAEGGVVVKGIREVTTVGIVVT